MTPKKMITVVLLLTSLTFLLNGCSVFSFLSGPNCASQTERRPGDLVTGQKPADATTATLCTDRTDYNKGDTVHITFTVKNLLDEQIVLDGGQRPVMDICVSSVPCLSYYQPDVAQLTHLVLEAGQSYTLRWDWPPTGDLSKSMIFQTNAGNANGNWIGLDKGLGTVSVPFSYGPRRDVP